MPPCRLFEWTTNSYCLLGGVVVEVVVEEVVVEEVVVEEVVVEEVVVKGTLVEVEINSPCNLWDHKMGYISNKT